MEKKYKHIKYEDRVGINQLLRAGISKAEIAKQLGLHSAMEIHLAMRRQ